MTSKEITVPDIGDFQGVEIIEVLVSAGDSVSKEDSLITLESDKASMEIPSPEAGVVKEMKVQLGDKVSEGDPILVLELAAADAAGSDAPAATKSPEAATAPEPEQPPTTAAPEPRRPAPAATPGLPESRPSPTAHIEPAAFKKAHASPSVRRFARELGVDLTQVEGSG
ncbi:MAG: E3 binding domain-containing protein, partial [Chromatiales bacterium]